MMCDVAVSDKGKLCLCHNNSLISQTEGSKHHVPVRVAEQLQGFLRHVRVQKDTILLRRCEKPVSDLLGETDQRVHMVDVVGHEQQGDVKERLGGVSQTSLRVVGEYEVLLPQHERIRPPA